MSNEDVGVTMIMRKGWLYILLVFVFLAIVSVSIFVYQVNKPKEPRTVYVLPESGKRVSATVLKASSPPTPQVRKPVVNEEPERIDASTEVDDTELQEFLELVETAAFDEESEVKEFDLMELTPDEMVLYLTENYTPREQHDFLGSGEGEDWIRHAFNVPPIQAPDPAECRDEYHGDPVGFSSCMEQKYQAAIALHASAFSEAMTNIQDFFAQLDPEVFSYSRNEVSATIVPSVPPPEPSLRKPDF